MAHSATEPKTNGERAIALTLRSQSANSPKEAFIRSEVKAFGGTVITVTSKSADDRLFDSFVFCRGPDDHFFFNAGELARYLDTTKPSNSFRDILLVDTDRAPAVIAVIITLTICYVSITYHGESPPVILGNALTSILGFYFGSKVSGSLKKGPQDPL
jgi:hypothetical protein